MNRRGRDPRAASASGSASSRCWILLPSVDVGAAIDVLRQADLAIVALMVVSVVLDVAFRGARWRALLDADPAVAYPRVLGYTYIGYLANNVLPARLGELVRSHALGEGEGLSRTTVLGTIVVERILDTLIVVGLAAPGGGRARRGRGAVDRGPARGGLRRRAAGRADRRDPEPPAARRRPRRGRGRAVPASRRPRAAPARRPARSSTGRDAVAGALVFSALAWTFSIATFILGGRAIGIELTLAQGALLSSGVALATIVPSGPGYLGTFELTAVGIASQFGIDRDAAFAMALLVHAMILLVTSIGGAIAALRLGVGLETGSDEEDEARARVDAADRRRLRRAIRDGVVDHRPVVRLEVEPPGRSRHADELERVGLVHLAEQADRFEVVRATGRGARLGPRRPDAERQARFGRGLVGPLK